MLEVHIPSVGPEAEGPRQSPEKSHMAFRVEVLCRGRRHTVLRRYSEFHALHKRIKKLYKVPDFPSKRLPNWRTRGLEQRRQALEAYIQGVLYLNQDVPKELLEFLSLRHFPTDPKASSWSSQLHHRPVISFCVDPYISIPSPARTRRTSSVTFTRPFPDHRGLKQILCLSALQQRLTSLTICGLLTLRISPTPHSTHNSCHSHFTEEENKAQRS
ncbi:sorting nexin-22 isoform X1 [Equus quagga]|uniref:sorting nexin-22 isoform X1 n=1 Tax=Equus quagga TaxID=89248 RepID=UPI001EE29340|nr:sorting nexin-22 isoform X1 [Equus quagga]